MFGLESTKKSTKKSTRKIKGLGLVLALLVCCSPVMATSLDEKILSLKSDVSAHAADVFELEQKVLHPVDTRLVVFLALAGQGNLDLDSVELFVNEQPVASHLYTSREIRSIEQAGTQQFFTGNLANGPHELKAVITARSANDRFVRREATHRFQKRPGALRLQMSLDARAPDYEPRISFVERK